jgi:uncharacterized protein YbbK (DUF523 family)
MIRSEIVEKLKKYADFITVCPEVEIGLGIPRRPIRIVVWSGDHILVQPANDKDVTKEMKDFTNSFLDKYNSVDDFILKSRSPSCGIGDVKLYSKAESALAKGPKFSSFINILHHLFGYVSKNLTKEEKELFLDMIEMYREDRTPLSACFALIKSWVVRFNVEYLANQTIFEPYPLELGETFDTNRWRNYWK